MCKPGDDHADVEMEAEAMGDREGIADRRSNSSGAIDVGRWLVDTLRMWPIIALAFTVGLRGETTRAKVDSIERDFVSEGPRVSTERDRPTTIEAELERFQSELRLEYMPREVLDLRINQILKDGEETRKAVEDLRKAFDDWIKGRRK